MDNSPPAPLRSSTPRFPVVGIGASAGGLSALLRFFENLPNAPGMAFVVVLHLSPDQESSADAILQRATSMPVVQVTHDTRIEADRVYVIAPALRLTMNDDRLQVARMEWPRGQSESIDLFFRTLAQTHRARAIAVILSGSGSDGSVGLADIKSEGGVILVQTPSDAEFDGMPASAISTRLADFVLPASEIPDKLVRLRQQASRIELPNHATSERGATPSETSRRAEPAEAALREIMLLLQERTGHDFSHYKRSTVLRRLQRRMQVTGQPYLQAYRTHLEQNMQETQKLVQDLLISVTRFFRDRQAFEALERCVAETLFGGRKPPTHVRGWTVGCATGEEAYSLAMVLNDHAPPSRHTPIQVFASDIDAPALAAARHGSYAEGIIADVSPVKLRQYFRPEGRGYRVNKALRDQLIFAVHNVLSDPPFSKLDVITCRNLLIYLERDVQAHVLNTFHFALNPGGLLFLGSAESADWLPNGFSIVDKKHRIYRAEPISRQHVDVPGVRSDKSLAKRAPLPPTDRISIDQDIDMAEEDRPRHAEVPDGRPEEPPIASRAALRTSNRQLQSTNEELRTATEELETSKEELQAVNEELTTVNFELKRKVDEAAKINDDLNNLIVSMDIATVFIDRDTNIKRFTPRAADAFNILWNDIGRSLLDLTHRLDYPEMGADIAQALARLQTVEREVHAQHGRWFLVRISPYRIGEDRIDGVVLNLIDVTARRTAEEALRAREHKLRLVAENTRDYAIMTMDANGRVTSWNLGAELMFGYTEAEMLGARFCRIFVPEDQAAGQPDLELRLARENGRALDERWHLRKDGSRFYCSGITTPIPGDAGDGYAKIARDLTERQLLERQREELLQAEQQVRQQLETAHSMRSEFLAIMSHELKNPLNLILLNAELIATTGKTRASPTANRAVDIIRQTVHSQSQIIDDLLDLSRLNTGKMTLHRTAVELQPLIERIVNAVDSQAAAKHIEVVTTLDDLVVFGDLVRIEQIVWNLVSNALKFTPHHGRIALRLQRDEGHAKLTVQDSGQGIDPKLIGHIFEMFEQGHGKYSTRREGGLGIGLALVRNLTELHGGRVEVESSGIGHGATFHVWLPVFEGALAHGDAATESVLAERRILLVEDDPDTLESMTELLASAGAQLTPASSAHAALRHAENETFDIVLSDIAMPGMDGYELIAELRRRPQSRDWLAIALTGFGRPSDVEQALAAGFDMHLAKPVALAELTAAIAKLMAQRN